MNVLVVDVGGTDVEVLGTGQKAERGFASRPKSTSQRMVAELRKGVADRKEEK